MNRIALLAASLVALAFLPSQTRAQNETPSAESLYTHAVAHMDHFRQPSSVAYHVTLDAQGVNVTIARKSDGTAAINFSTDGAPAPHAQFEAEYNDAVRGVAIAFVPLWSGVDAWLRFGLKGEPDAAPTAGAIGRATAAPPVIAVVRTLGTGNYRVDDGGEAACPNGDAGHRVHLTPRGDAATHPLTDATIDAATGTFCLMRFDVYSVHVTGFGASISSSIEVALGTEDGYSIVKHQHFVGVVRRFGIHVQDVAIDIAYTDFRFH